MTAADLDIDIPVGAPCWMDLVSSDPDRSVAFYTELFSWTVQDSPPDFGGYRYFEKDGRAVGGCMRNEPDWGAPDAWSIYLRSSDVRATAEAAQAQGGALVMGPMDVQDNGSFVILRDAGGAVVSAWQPGTEAGFGVLGEERTPVHFELHARDYDKSVPFYRDVFGWEPQMLDAPGFRYSTYGDPSDPKAGIMDASMFLPDDAQPHWSVYLGVADVDATLDRAVELGGSLVAAAEDTPYGRLASLTDPTGAMFRLRG